MIVYLKDICKYYQPSTISKKEMIDDGEYNVYGANGVIGKYNKYNHEDEQILLGCRGTCGIINISEPYSWINGNAMVIKPDEDKVLKKYIYYFLKNYNFKDGIITGTSQPQITGKSLDKIRLDLPSLKEQQKIVKKLANIDKIIENKSNDLKDLESLKNSIFINYFGDPVINDKKWNTLLLAELGSLKNGLNFDKVNDGYNYKFLGVGEFKFGNNISGTKSLQDIILKNEISDDYLLKNDDIIFVRSNGSKELVGRSLLITNIDKPTTYSGFCIRFRNNSELIYPSFLINLFQNRHFKDNLMNDSRGANINNINQQILSKAFIIIPPKELQQKFCDNIIKINKLIDNCKKDIDDLEKLMKVIMNQSFNCTK